jgi:hypothetical protein
VSERRRIGRTGHSQHVRAFVVAVDRFGRHT